MKIERRCRVESLPFRGVLLPTARMISPSGVLLFWSFQGHTRQVRHRLGFGLQKKLINISGSLMDDWKLLLVQATGPLSPHSLYQVPIVFIHACKLPTCSRSRISCLHGWAARTPNACKPVPAPANQRRQASPSPCINTCNEAVGEENPRPNASTWSLCQRIAVLLRGFRGGGASPPCVLGTRYDV